MRVRLVAAVVALALLSGCLGLSVPDSSGAGTVTSADASPTGESSVLVTVTEVVDGDTVKVRYANGSRETVRLLGVDTPEVHGSNAPGEFEGVPDSDAGVACLEDAGERASSYARGRLEGQQVRLVFDERSDRRGDYGRLLAYVYVGGDSFNYALVSAGHARVYESTFTERERYEGAERTARAEGRGLWSCAGGAGDATAAADADIELVRVHPDAAGDDY